MFWLFFTVGIASFLVLGYLLFSYRLTGVPYVATANRHLPELFTALEIKPDTVFYDLGSGSGRVLFALEQSGAKHLVGYELSPLLALYSRLKARLSGSVAIIREENFLTADLSEADIWYAFLVPTAVARLYEHFKSSGKPGARLVILADAIPNIAPTQTIRLNKGKSRAYVYRQP